MPNEPTNLVTSQPAGILDVLDRVLDKGLVVVGDIRISLVNVELLTLQIRLLVCSIDKAEQIGIDWWRFDPNLNPRLEARTSSGEADAGNEPAKPKQRSSTNKLT